jgi:hypothetical protein
MLIEFYLPAERGGFLPMHAARRISQEIAKWAERHDIAYQEKTVKLIHRVCFADDRYYVFFKLTWNPPGNAAWWYNFRIIVDRERDQPL